MVLDATFNNMSVISWWLYTRITQQWIDGLIFAYYNITSFFRYVQNARFIDWV
jgi:hypothetical protein